jgi:hypothetical protein
MTTVSPTAKPETLATTAVPVSPLGGLRVSVAGPAVSRKIAEADSPLVPPEAVTG